MAGTFDARMAELDKLVGEGDLTAHVEVDQPYAFWVHERLELNHPVGQAKFLEAEQVDMANDFLKDVADNVLDGQLRPAMINVAEDFAAGTEARTPVEFGDLHRSAHPTVVDNGAVIYDRAPAQPPLSYEQILAKRRGSSAP